MKVPRVVLDSNVIISAFLFGGQPGQVLRRVIGGSVLGFTSLPILDEVRGVLLRPEFGLSPEQVLALIEELHALCRVVATEIKVHDIRCDPDDNRILECALAAGADVIVSGDAHLLHLSTWNTIRILSPAQFLSEMER